MKRKSIYRMLSFVMAGALVLGSVPVQVRAAASEEAAPMAEQAVINLTDLNWASAVSGWKTVQKNKNVGGKPLVFQDGSQYSTGLGAHAASEIVYNLDGQYGRFTGLAGIDNEAVGKGNTAACRFQIFGDGMLLWESKTMGADAGHYGPEAFDVTVQGIRELRLVTALENSSVNTSCWTNWADTKLHPALDETLMLNGLQVDGTAVADFNPHTFQYVVEIEPEDLLQIESIAVPQVSAEALAAQVTVEQAEQVPGTAVVRVENENGTSTYQIQFVLKDTSFLSDLTPESVQGNAVGMDKNFEGNPIRILQTPYQKGLGMKGDSTITYHLGGEYVRFLTSFGLDDQMTDDYAQGTFVVKCDGVVRHTMTINRDDQGWHNKVTDINVEKVQTLELSLLKEEGSEADIYGAWGSARVLKGEPSGTLLEEILVDGESLEGFADSKMSYEVSLLAGTTEVPRITARAQDADAQVVVEQAEELPGTSRIIVTKGEHTAVYEVHFLVLDEHLQSIEVSVDHPTINPVKNRGQVGTISVNAFMGNGDVLTQEDEEVEVTYELATLKSSGGVEIARVDENGIITPLKNAEYVEEGMEEAWNGGTGKVTVTVKVGDRTKTKDVSFAVAPFWVDYSKTLVMKMDFHMMARNNAVNMNFADALEVIKRYDNMTRGIPKIVYLVGWQSDGHDTGYPSWDEVDEYLKIPGMTAKESLAYLMQEAKKYNTTVSFHLNMTTTYTDSPLYDEYYAKDILGRRADGGLTVYGEGGVISYTRDWELGTMRKRMERLIETYPTLAEAHTIHSDAFHVEVPRSTTGFGQQEPVSVYAQEKYGYSRATDIESMRKMFQYWRTLGMDLTSEFVDSYRPSDVSGNEAFIGLQPMAWHFRKADQNWNMQIPAALYTGGDGGSALFGTSHTPEGALNPTGNPDRWLSDFATSTLSWQYLNSFERISATDTSVVFSDGVTTENTDKGVVIRENGKVLAEGSDYFIPALWNEDYPEIIVYSGSGYGSRTWAFPSGWEDIASADVYQITENGLTERVQSGVDITSGEITLTAARGKGYSVVPAGTDVSRKVKAVEEVSLEETELALQAGDKKRLHARILPFDATDKGVRWESSDPEVAEAANTGIVTALKEGTAVITGKTVDGELTASCAVTVEGSLEKIAPITANQSSGVYGGPIDVELKTATQDADIYYTLDGTQPGETSLYYSENSTDPAPIEVMEDTVIKAVAMKDGMITSDVLTLTYEIQEPGVSAVRAIAQPDHYTSTQAVYLTCASEGADIYFSIDGSEPSRDSESSIRYNTSSPLTLNSDTTVKAIAYQGDKVSKVQTFTYTFTDQTTKTLTPYVLVNGKPGMGGVYTEPVTVQFLTRTPDSTIYYTTNGSNPTSSSAKYTEPITLTESTSFKVMADDSGSKAASNYGWFNFIIDTTGENRAAPAQASVESGKYGGPFALKLSTSTPGAVVRYTVSGRVPRLYTATYKDSVPLLIKEDTTVTAVSYKDGMMDGETRVFRYSIGEGGTVIEPEKPDKSALEELVERVADQKLEGHSEELAAAFREALQKAEDILRDQDLTLEDMPLIQKAQEELQAAWEALKKEVILPGEDAPFDYASDLTPASVKVGYGSLGIDKTVNNSGTLKLGGISYDKGLGAHAPAELVYDLQGNYNFFHAVVGIDDSRVGNTNLGTVQFQIFLDEESEPAYESAVMGTNSRPETIDLPIEGAQKLRIAITTPEGKNTNDWTDVADARLYLSEEGMKHAKQTIEEFAVAGQVNETEIDPEKHSITVKVPYGTDVTNLEIEKITYGVRTSGNLRAGNRVNASEPITVMVKNLAGEAVEWIIRVVVKEQKAILESDNKTLEESFLWATHKVDQFVMTGKSGLVNYNKGGGRGPVDYMPSYWAGYYHRTAFYGRDFSHQATGGQLAGLRDENFQMFKTFAKGATESRKYYTLWAFNFDGSPYTVDYKSDTNFVREVPAQFELVQRAYEQYRWTGDERYLYDEDLFNFYTNVMTKYVELHDDKFPNGIPEGTGKGIFQGSCTYNERSGEPAIEAGDAIGSQYQATLAYAGILKARGETQEADKWYQKADELKTYFNEVWSVNPEGENAPYARVRVEDGTMRYDWGKENSWFMPMKLITQPGPRNDAYLDFISECLGDGIKTSPTAPTNIEAYTYIPDTFFPYNRSEEAWKWMKYIMSVKDEPHEQKSQGTNGDYPEISFTFVSQVIEGLMGIEANAGAHSAVTASRLTKDMNYVDIKDVRMGSHMLDIRHDGLTKTTMTNHSEEGLTWEARFYGDYPAILVDGQKAELRQKEVNGVLVSYTVIDIPAEGTVEVQVSSELNKEALRAAIEEAKAYAQGYEEANTTPTSWNAYQEALAQAQKLSEPMTGTQESLDAAAQALKTASRRLAHQAGAEAVAKLQMLAELGADMESRYPAQVYEPMKDALKQAEALLAKETAEVEEAEAREVRIALENARAALLDYKPVNTGVLEEAVQMAKGLDRGQYTEESYARVAEALKAAETADQEDQSAVDQAVKALVEALCGLETKEPEEPAAEYAALEALKAAVEQAGEVNRADYTAGSLRVLDQAAEVAKAMIDGHPARAMQPVVDRITLAVQEALAGLEKKAEERPDAPNPGIQKPEIPKKHEVHRYNGLVYQVTSSKASGGTVKVLGSEKKGRTSVRIPNTVKLNGHVFRVTEIGKNAFRKNGSLKRVTVGNFVTKIGGSAFYQCKKLTSVTLGSGVKTIGKKAFYGDKKLTKLKIKSKGLKKVYASSLKGISSKAVIDVPNKKKGAYKLFFKNRRIK